MKKIRILSLILAVLSFSLVFNSCEKDNLTLLTEGTWQFENFTTTSDNSDIQSIIAFGKAALTDGTLDFTSDGNYTMDSPIIEAETGEYELIGNNQINFKASGSVAAIPSTIEEIKKDKLVYNQTYIYLDVESYTVTYTWVR